MSINLIDLRLTGTHFPMDVKFDQALQNAAIEQGLVCYPMAGATDGKNGSHVLLTLPFILADEQLEEIVEN